jgi:hypothetical protein
MLVSGIQFCKHSVQAYTAQQLELNSFCQYFLVLLNQISTDFHATMHSQQDPVKLLQYMGSFK